MLHEFQKVTFLEPEFWILAMLFKASFGESIQIQKKACSQIQMLHSKISDFHNIEFFHCLNQEFMQTLAFTL